MGRTDLLQPSLLNIPFVSRFSLDLDVLLRRQSTLAAGSSAFRGHALGAGNSLKGLIINEGKMCRYQWCFQVQCSLEDRGDVGDRWVVHEALGASDVVDTIQHCNMH